MLAYRLFIDPINLFHEWWFLLLPPLALFISMSYKAVRVPTMDRYWREVVMMTVHIVLAMIGLAIASFFVVQVLARFIIDRGS